MFKPKLPNDEVNIPKGSGLLEFIKLIAGFCLFVFVLLFIVQIFFTHASQYIPFSAEKMLSAYLPSFENEKKGEAQKYLNDLMHKLVLEAELTNALDFDLMIMDSTVPNALSLPGGKIILTTQIIKDAESENELVMIIGHELGHIKYRHHLRSVGRAMALGVVGFLGRDVMDGFSIVSSLMGVTQSQFSQGDELEADSFALDVLNKTYHHVSGAHDFFSRMRAKSSPLEEKLHFVMSHPSNERRLDELDKLISKKGYHYGEMEPKNVVLENLLGYETLDI